MEIHTRWCYASEIGHESFSSKLTDVSFLFSTHVGSFPLQCFFLSYGQREFRHSPSSGFVFEPPSQSPSTQLKYRFVTFSDGSSNKGRIKQKKKNALKTHTNRWVQENIWIDNLSLNNHSRWKMTRKYFTVFSFAPTKR